MMTITLILMMIMVMTIMVNSVGYEITL